MTLTKDQTIYMERLFETANRVHKRFSEEEITDYKAIRPWVSEQCDPVKHLEGLDKKETECMLVASATAMRWHKTGNKTPPQSVSYALVEGIFNYPGFDRLAEQMDLIKNVILGR